MSNLQEASMIYPGTVTASYENWEQAGDAVEVCLKVYRDLIKAGIPPEDARYFLPQASPTRLMVTANFREWRYIIKLRTAPDAQWEIRELVEKIRDKLQEQAPSVFEDLK